MSSGEFELQSTKPVRSRLGWLVVLGALTVAVTAAVVAGVVLDNARNGRMVDRTVWGVLLMAVGFAGPIVALVLLVRRRDVIRQVAERRWTAVAVFPGAFVVAWAAAAVAYGVLGKSATEPIIPHTSEFVVTFDSGGRPGFSTVGDFGGSSETRGVRGRATAFKYLAHARRSQGHPVEFEGAFVHPDADRPGAEVSGALTTTRRVRLRVDGLSDAVVLIDGNSAEQPVELEPGTYQLTIQGTPRD